MFRMIGGLGIGGACGLFASLAGIPLPWLVGPLIATALFSLGGLDLRQPVLLRKVGQGVAAIAIGLSFSPAVVESLAGYLHIMVLAAAASMIGAVVIARLVAMIARISFETAFFSSLPGGVAEMSVLAERYGGEIALVALAQSLRIIIVVLTIPAVIVALTGHGELVVAPASSLPTNLPVLAIMFLAALAVALLFDRLKVMNAWFLAGLAIGIVIAVGEIPASGVPFQIVDAAQVLIGCALGSRIDRGVIVRLRHFLPTTILGTSALIAFNVAIAAVVAIWTGIDVAPLVLALAPGGVAEMSITAKALHLAVPLVTAFHLVRVLMIILLSAPLYRGVAWLRNRAGAGQPAE